MATYRAVMLTRPSCCRCTILLRSPCVANERMEAGGVDGKIVLLRDVAP